VITSEYKLMFEKKVTQLRSQYSMKIKSVYTHITVKRRTLFNDAYQEIMKITPQNLRNELSIVFLGEKGVDCGGLLR